MANIKSAKKRILQSNKKRFLNKSVRSATRTEIKKFLTLAQNTDIDPKDKVVQLRKVESLVDKAAGKGVIHKNKAARIKSRLTKQLHILAIDVVANPTAATVPSIET